MKSATPIAIIGMACRYPGAANLPELWENILACRQQFRDMPEVRLPADEYYDPDNRVADKTYGRRAAVLDGFEFDPRHYRIPKSSYESTDIVHWLALATALEAFKHAGMQSGNIPNERSGVILGNTLTGEETRANLLRLRWPFVRKVFQRTAELHGLSPENTRIFAATMERLYKSVFPEITEDSLAGGLANTIAGRICNYLDLHGGGYIVDGACSSSLLAVATAADYLHQHKMDLVLAGGVDVSLDTFELIGFAKATALSKDEMRVYDRRGNGFIPGEGCGMVVLKRLEDARRDGDQVLAVLRGWGISSDGRGGITAPSVKGQAKALVRAYRNAGYSPQQLDFIEGHGTGTVVGDKVELEGIASAIAEFGEVASHSIGVTSFKSIVGHTKAAAGIGGLIKTVIALNRRVLPPLAGCQLPHPSFNETAQALYPIVAGRICAADTHLRAGVSAMGFGGINCHVTLESADPPTSGLQPSVSEQTLLASRQQSEIFPFSATDLPALLAEIRAKALQAKGISTGEMPDMAATCASTVQNLPWRAAVIASSVADLSAKLASLEVLVSTQPLAAGAIGRGEQIVFSYQAACNRIGLLFPGQGSQQLGMAKILTDRFEWARQFSLSVDQETEAVRTALNYPSVNQALSTLYLAGRERDPGDKLTAQNFRQLTQTENAQPAICAASWLWYQRLLSLGINATAVAGHSLGELTALAAAGVYAPATLVRVAALRGIAMSAASTAQSGGMAALACDTKTAESLLNAFKTGYCVIANRNSPKQTIISGESLAVKAIMELGRQQGIRGSELAVSNAFHSRFMLTAAEQLRQSEIIPKVTAKPGCKVFSGINGQEISAGLELNDYIAAQMLSAVDFSSVLNAMSGYCDWFIETGPGGVLTGLVQAHANLPPCLPVESRAGLDADFNAVVAEAFIRGGALNWQALHADRFIRPFIPTAQRKFYVNPCERELVDIDSGATPLSTGESLTLLKLPPENPPSSTHSPADTSSPVLAQLFALVAARTGFDTELLTAEQRLLDDLNIDSIKASALLADLLLQTRTQGLLQTGNLANARLGEIAAQVENALHQNGGITQPAAKPAPARWVRAFSTVMHQENLPSLAQRRRIAPETLLLIAPGGISPFAQEFAEQLGTTVFNDTPPANFAETPANLLILLDISTDFNAKTALDRLTVLHRLHQQQPALWQNLQSLVFVLRRSHAMTQPWPAIRTFTASLHQERPELELLLLDVDQQLSVEFVSSHSTILSGEARYQALEIDADGQAYRQTLALLEPEACQPRNLIWTPDDVWLVSGGGKGITAECALAFARETGVKLALLGRSSPPLPDENSELAMTLQKLDAAGVTYRYYPANIADAAALSKVVAAVEQELGAITAVLHGAGGNIPRRLLEVDAIQAESEIAPKLRGAENLLAIFEQTPLKLFAAFTSIIGVTGMRNNGWYAYSNESVAQLLNTYAHTHPQTAVISYAFGIWDEVGMGVKLGSVEHLQQMGIAAIPLQEGVAQFLHWLRYAPPAPEVVITAGGIPERLFAPAGLQPGFAGRFLGVSTQLTPGVERICRVTLDSRDDLYLNDHNFRGSLLLPTVMGLEAMAQNCLALTGDLKLEILRIEDIRLDQPIVITPDQPTSIEIRTLALPRRTTADPHVVTASIHTAQNAWQAAHFTATFILGQRQPGQTLTQIPAHPDILGIIPSTDLYGSVLFQGPLFQRICAIADLSSEQLIFITQTNASTSLQPEGFSAATQAPLVLGDPYYRDTLLQASQLSLTPNICLPVRIAAIEFYAANRQTACYRALARVTGRAGSRVFGEVLVVDDANQVIERISGYEVQIVAHNTGLPNPEQLAAYSGNPHTHFQQQLDAAARNCGFIAPVAILCELPVLQGQKKPLRHILEIPAFKQALHLAGQRAGFDAKLLKVEWLASGKPVVMDRTVNSMQALAVSLSHERNRLLCVAGTQPQGCDLTFVEQRSQAQWQAMFDTALMAPFQILQQQGDNPDQAGSRLWSVLEAAIKAFDTRELKLEIQQRQADTVIFLATCQDKQAHILSLPNRTGTDCEYMLAVTVSAATPPPAVSQSSSQGWSDWLADGGDTSDFFGMKTELATDNQQRTIRFRFPPAFKDAANPDGSVYFVRFFEWMGRLREMALRPVQANLTAEFAAGKTAWVTNQSWLQIHQPLLAGDVVQVNCRFLGRGGPDDATLSVDFDWQGLKPNGELQALASSRIQMTWAHVVSHGVVTPAAYPDYLDRFFKELSTDEAANRLDLQANSAYHSSLQRLGAIVWRAAAGPDASLLLHQQNFSTSLNDANLVGNLYYTKYYELQGIVSDSYFYRIIPAAYQTANQTGGLRCLFSEVKHLRDAMPFDTLQAKMYLQAVYETGLELGFDFFRVNQAGETEKLAVGVLVLGWSVLSGSDYRLTSLPEVLRRHLEGILESS